MKNLEKIKVLAMAMFVAVLGLSFTGCSDDDDDDYNSSVITDYYMTCTMSGGGLTNQELDFYESQINATLTSYYWEGIQENVAVYYFDSEIDDWKYTFSEGLDFVTGTLKITFFLKTKDGKTVRTAVLNVTNSGCTKG